MDKNKKIFAVLGLGGFGQSIAINLANRGYEVLGIDKSEEKIQSVLEHVTHAVQGDVTDLEMLSALGISNVDVVIISIGKDMESSIMATLLVKELGAKYVITKASSEEHKKLLEKIGADRVILPEKEMGRRIATNLVSKNIIDYIELSADYSIIEIEVLPNWVGKTLSELNLREKYGINVMAIRHLDKITISFEAEMILNENDILVVIGENSKLNTIYKK